MSDQYTQYINNLCTRMQLPSKLYPTCDAKNVQNLINDCNSVGITSIDNCNEYNYIKNNANKMIRDSQNEIERKIAIQNAINNLQQSQSQILIQNALKNRNLTQINVEGDSEGNTIIVGDIATGQGIITKYGKYIYIGIGVIVLFIVITIITILLSD